MSANFARLYSQVYTACSPSPGKPEPCTDFDGTAEAYPHTIQDFRASPRCCAVLPATLPTTPGLVGALRRRARRLDDGLLLPSCVIP
jgi:hypothetical protein